MPFIFDFKNCVEETPNTIVVTPRGWRGPVTVEYAHAQAHEYDTQCSIVWRVKGTTHTFTIYEQKLNVISKGDYGKHFKEALEGFREDYLTWFTSEEYRGAVWKEEYKRQFGRFINPENGNGSKNNER